MSNTLIQKVGWAVASYGLLQLLKLAWEEQEKLSVNPELKDTYVDNTYEDQIQSKASLPELVNKEAYSATYCGVHLGKHTGEIAKLQNGQIMTRITDNQGVTKWIAAAEVK